VNKSDAKEIWQATLAELQSQVNRTNYDTWLKDTIGISYQNDQFVVGVPSPFAIEWLEKRLHSLITKTLIGITGDEVEVNFEIHVVEPSVADKEKRRRNAKNGHTANGRKTGPCPFNPKYTFDCFIVGHCNRLAHAAALAVAEKPGVIYNPLFIYGGVGLGKTHLLHAVGHLASASGLRVLYISTEQFTNEFIRAIRERKTEEFREKCRNVDVLLIDDIQFLIGKEQTQEGFFHTFNDLHNANRQIIITSDRPPRSMPLLEDRLSSRFTWGLIADIQPPDLETSLAILQVKAEEQEVMVPKEILDLVARRGHKSIRELEGCLNRVIAFAKLTEAHITLELASQALTEVIDPAPKRDFDSAYIIGVVAKYFELEPAALTGKSRDKMTSLARHVAVYLMREEVGHAYAAIGRELGGRDHSGILRGYEKITEQMNANPQLRGDILEIRDLLYSKSP